MKPIRRDILSVISGGIAGSLFTEQLKSPSNYLDNSNSWPSFQFDMNNSGNLYSINKPIEKVEEQWRVSGVRPGEPGTSPLVFDDLVYGGGSAYRINSGEGVWTSSAGAEAFLSGNQIISTSQNNSSYIAIDIKDGSTNWRSEDFSGDALHPGASNDHLLTLGDLGMGAKLDLESGEKITTISIGIRTRDWGVSFAVKDGIGYHVGDAGGRVKKLDIELLNEVEIVNDAVENVINLDSFTPRYPYSFHPTVDDRSIYVVEGKRVVSIDQNAETISWDTDLAGATTGSIAVNNDSVVAVSKSNTSSGKVYNITKSGGSITWDTETAGIPYSPIIAGESIYLGDSQGYVYSINLSSGDINWKYNVGSTITSSVAIDKNHIFVNTANGELIALTSVPNEKPNPQFTYSPDPPVVDEPIEFDASDSTDNIGIESYYWDFDNGSSDSGLVTNETFFEPKSYDVKLTVVDELGLEAESTKVIDVIRPRELPDPNYIYTPSEPTVGEEVTFDASDSTVQDGDIVSYNWEFDGGSQMNGEKVKKHFDEPGEYTVSLEVVDEKGLTNNSVGKINIKPEKVNFSLTGNVTEVEVGGVASMTLSVTNFLTSEELNVQLLVDTPSGVSVSSISGAESGSDQFSAVSTLEPSDHTNIRIDLQVNEKGTHNVRGIADYYFGEDESDSDRFIDTVTVNTGSEENTDGDRGSSVVGDSDSGDSIPGFNLISSAASVATGAYIYKKLTDVDFENKELDQEDT